MMKAFAGAAALLVLAGCGPAEAPAATAGAEPADACPTGSPLPVTGLCSNGDASLFLASDVSLQTAAPRCVWRTEEVSLSPAEALVFRAQDCSGEGWDKAIYTYVSGYLKTRLSSMAEDQSGFALEIIPLAASETAEQAAMRTLDKAPEDQRARCITSPLTGHTVAGRTFGLGPDADSRPS